MSLGLLDSTYVARSEICRSGRHMSLGPEICRSVRDMSLVARCVACSETSREIQDMLHTAVAASAGRRQKAMARIHG